MYLVRVLPLQRHALAGALALLVACAGDDGDDGTTPEPLEPAVTIASPGEGEAVPAGAVTVTLELEDFELTGRLARRAGPLDALVPSAEAHVAGEDPNGYVELKLDGVVVAEEAATSIVVQGVLVGEHILTATLRYPDGDSFFPDVNDRVTFTAE